MGQWVYISMGASLLLSIISFIAGLIPVAVGLLVLFVVLIALSARAGSASAARAERNEHLDTTEDLGPAHGGQAHMTPDKL